MDEITTQLHSPVYWVCSVIIGSLLMNLASHQI